MGRIYVFSRAFPSVRGSLAVAAAAAVGGFAVIYANHVFGYGLWGADLITVCFAVALMACAVTHFIDQISVTPINTRFSPHDVKAVIRRNERWIAQGITPQLIDQVMPAYIKQREQEAKQAEEQRRADELAGKIEATQEGNWK